MKRTDKTDRKPRDENERIQREFMRMLPQIRAVIRFKYPRCDWARRRMTFWEFQHEVITMCFRDFRRLVTSGRESRAFATPLATFACMQVNDGRTICGAGKKDALDHVEQGGIAGVDFDTDKRPTRQNVNLDTTEGSQVDGAPESAAARWEDFLISDGRFNPALTAQAFLDFAAFLAILTPRLRAIAVALACGYSPSFVATMFGVSRGRVSQFRTHLRMLWNRRIG